jgi:AcrR family transcriptional regulator
VPGQDYREHREENLFLSVLNDTYGAMRDRVRDIVDRNLRDVDDVESALSACFHEIVGSITRAPERGSLVRLVMSEAPHFPALLEMWHNRGIVPIIAEHLSALTFGQVNNKSMMGAIPLSDAESDRIISSGIDVFMRAYAPRTP